MTETSTTTDRPLGSETPPYGRINHIIGDLDVSMSGNTVMRIGELDVEADQWHQIAHLVLTPAERGRLIGALMEHSAAVERAAR